MPKGLNIDVEKIKTILKDSIISAYTDVVCISLKKNPESNELYDEFIRTEGVGYAITGSLGKKTITILINEKILDKARKAFKNNVMEVNEKTGAIFLKCPKEVNSTPGVTAYISSLFSEQNVSILEMISTYTDYAIILDEEDTFKMAAVLKEEIGC